MKKVKVEAAEPVMPKKNGYQITTQMVDGNILVLNFYKNKVFLARHCINTVTKEYASFKKGIWSTLNIENLMEFKLDLYRYSYNELPKSGDKYWSMSKADEDEIKKIFEAYHIGGANVLRRIEWAERYYNDDCRERKELNRQKRVEAMMDRVLEIPFGIKEWIDEKELGKENYCIKDSDTKLWSCSACGKEFDKSKIKRADGEENPRNNDKVICPCCNKSIKFLTRKKQVNVTTHFCMVQPIDNEVSVTRYFTAYIECVPGKKKAIGIDEDVRLLMFKGIDRKKDCDIYYEHAPARFVKEGHKNNLSFFDNKSNPRNKRMYPGYMYDGGIEEAFKGTKYEAWSRLFSEFSATNIKLSYNQLMCSNNKRVIGMMEMLYRGRFYRLLQEESKQISVWSHTYCGDLNFNGNSIEAVFGINDRQKINRIRDKNGGMLMVEWMRYSDECEEKISDRVLKWLVENQIKKYKLECMLSRFSVEQAMNYIERQKAEGYVGKKEDEVINQYADYIRMCETLKKDISDEMIFRPRELKRRHDEAVAAIERQKAQIKADEYSAKFSEAETVLKEIKSKFEYAGETFFIKVPEHIIDIVTDGNYLHHCAGLTDRYFDRIKQHETYICFLRKVSEPDIPFYTIEVEPGGTIRQHRGMYDEEPELDAVKPFLRDWQKEIKKRMKKEDRERAAKSKILREENIKDLKEKNNIRVLKGLMEDFMEAI